MNKKPLKYYYTFIAIAILGWGVSTPLIEAGLTYIPPFTFLFFRFLVASLVVTPYILIKKRDELFKLFRCKLVWIIGLSESAGQLFQYIGQDLGVPSSLAALLSLSFLLFVPFFSVIILKEKLHKIHLFAVLIGASGVTLIATHGHFTDINGLNTSMILGIIFLISSALSYALYIVFSSRLTSVVAPDVDVTVLFYLVLVIITVSSFIFTLSFESPAIPTGIEIWAVLLLLVLFSTIIAFLAYFESVKGISANTVSVLLLLQIFIPFFIESVFYKRGYPPVVLFGAFLLLIAMFLVVVIPIINERKR